MKNMNLALIRLAHPLAFCSYLKQVGAPTGRFFRRSGLPELCDDPNTFVSLRMAWQMFDDAANHEDQWLGWHVGEHTGNHRLHAGLLSKLESAPTLNQALLTLARLVDSEASHLRLGLRKVKNGAVFFTHYPGMRDQTGYHVSQAYQIAVYIDVIQHFAGADWSPTEVGVEATMIPTSLKDKFPSCTFRVGQAIGYIFVPGNILCRTVGRYHQEAQKSSSLVRTNKLDFTQTLSHLIAPYLPMGYPNMRLAAKLVDRSPRTLSRELAECGTSYQALIDKIRFELAAEKLVRTDEPVMEIASSVGFNDLANFSRMFTRIAGSTPREFRKFHLE